MIERRRIGAALDGIASISMILASATLVWVLLIRPSSAPPGAVGALAGPNRAAFVENVASRGLVMQVPDLQAGANQDARIALIEFADFECPFCGVYARETLPKIKQEFIDSGKVTYVFKHFPLAMHAAALPAAEVAACAGEQQRFWEMHDRLFADKSNLLMDAMMASAKTLQLDQQKLQTCLGSIKPRIERDTAEGRRLGIESTPTFLFGEIRANGSVAVLRKISGSHGYDTYKAVLRELLDAEAVKDAPNVKAGN
jgi:protein-disulfide isomerase